MTRPDGGCRAVPLDDDQLDDDQLDDAARLAAVLAALAALRMNSAGGGRAAVGRTGREALARWRTARLAALRGWSGDS